MVHIPRSSLEKYVQVRIQLIPFLLILETLKPLCFSLSLYIDFSSGKQRPLPHGQPEEVVSRTVLHEVFLGLGALKELFQAAHADYRMLAYSTSVVVVSVKLGTADTLLTPATPW